MTNETSILTINSKNLFSMYDDKVILTCPQKEIWDDYEISFTVIFDSEGIPFVQSEIFFRMSKHKIIDRILKYIFKPEKLFITHKINGDKDIRKNISDITNMKVTESAFSEATVRFYNQPKFHLCDPVDFTTQRCDQ